MLKKLGELLLCVWFGLFMLSLYVMPVCLILGLIALFIGAPILGWYLLIAFGALMAYGVVNSFLFWMLIWPLFDSSSRQAEGDRTLPS